METWPSGRRHLTANETGCYNPREFESLRLRQDILVSESMRLPIANERPECINCKQKYTR